VGNSQTTSVMKSGDTSGMARRACITDDRLSAHGNYLMNTVSRPLDKQAHTREGRREGSCIGSTEGASDGVVVGDCQGTWVGATLGNNVGRCSAYITMWTA
jgi:uncharacterized protein with von Willebrand factor type A (vWA) domain